MTLQKTTTPADYNAHLQPNWRICSPYKVIKDGDDKHPMALAIHAYSGVVMGVAGPGPMVYLPDEDLTGLIDVGAQIKIARLQHGLTMSSLAKALGTTAQAIRYWESGIRRPRYHRVQQSIESVLGVHVPISSADRDV
ncbi:hypothetical protein BRUR0010001c01_00010 [Bifidobacterium phage BlindUri1]|nr:hypothetical protein BRUR0010001c01_00010 [Bifidobacterium phage BlindUri1]